jgi:adhesin/invasin
MVMKRAPRRRVHAVILGVAIVTACDSSPLVAPVASTIAVFSSATALAPGGSAEITAVVLEEAGTSVHDGTVVRFTATLGTVDPAQAETRDGVATTTFTAGSAAGTAQVEASSGGAAAASDQPNVIEITIGG